jgi:hypothetical protein
MKMGNTKLILKVLILVCVSGIVVGCTKQLSPVGTATPTPSTAAAPASFITFKNYPDQTFNPKEYTNGMVKGGHNLLIWKDPAINLSQYASVKLTEFGGRLLPAQQAFSYDRYIALFNSVFRNSLKVPQKDSPDALLIEGAVVEVNPGSRATRYLVGFGAGKAACAVVCEVYEPGKRNPSVRIYVRDTGSMGAFGGDSVQMLDHIMSELGTRLATNLTTILLGH